MGNVPSNSSPRHHSSSRRSRRNGNNNGVDNNDDEYDDDGVAYQAKRVVGELQAGLVNGIKHLEEQDHPAAAFFDTVCGPFVSVDSGSMNNNHSSSSKRKSNSNKNKKKSYSDDEYDEYSRTVSEEETTVTTDYRRRDNDETTIGTESYVSSKNTKSNNYDESSYDEEETTATDDDTYTRVTTATSGDGQQTTTNTTSDQDETTSINNHNNTIHRSPNAVAANIATTTNNNNNVSRLLNQQPLASSFAKRCYFTKQGIGGNTQHYEGLTLTGNVVLMLAAAMKLRGCPTICDEDLRRVEQTYPNQFSRLPDELLLSSGWRRISKFCHFSNKPIPDGVPFFHSKQRLHPTGGYYFLLAAAVGMVRPIDVEPLTRDTLVLLETDFPAQCDAAPVVLIQDPDAWTLVDKFCFFSGGPINTDEDVYYFADFDGNPIYMLAFLSPSLTPAELYKLDSDEPLPNVAAVEEVESVYDLTERDFDDLKLYHLGPCRALPQYILQPQAWTKVLPPHFLEAREQALHRAREMEPEQRGYFGQPASQNNSYYNPNVYGGQPQPGYGGPLEPPPSPFIREQQQQQQQQLQDSHIQNYNEGPFDTSVPMDEAIAARTGPPGATTPGGGIDPPEDEPPSLRKYGNVSSDDIYAYPAEDGPQRSHTSYYQESSQEQENYYQDEQGQGDYYDDQIQPDDDYYQEEQQQQPNESYYREDPSQHINSYYQEESTDQLHGSGYYQEDHDNDIRYGQEDYPSQEQYEREEYPSEEQYPVDDGQYVQEEYPSEEQYPMEEQYRREEYPSEEQYPMEEPDFDRENQYRHSQDDYYDAEQENDNFNDEPDMPADEEVYSHNAMEDYRHHKAMSAFSPRSEYSMPTVSEGEFCMDYGGYDKTEYSINARRNPEIPPPSPSTRSLQDTDFSATSPAMRGAQELIRRNRQKRLEMARQSSQHQKPSSSSVLDDVDDPTTADMLSPSHESNSTWESGSQYSGSEYTGGSSMWTDNDNPDRSSRRALILQMARARMKNNKQQQIIDQQQHHHHHQQNNNNSQDLEEKKFDHRDISSSQDIDFAEDLD